MPLKYLNCDACLTISVFSRICFLFPNNFNHNVYTDVYTDVYTYDQCVYLFSRRTYSLKVANILIAIFFLLSSCKLLNRDWPSMAELAHSIFLPACPGPYILFIGPAHLKNKLHFAGYGSDINTLGQTRADVVLHSVYEMQKNIL